MKADVGKTIENDQKTYRIKMEKFLKDYANMPETKALILARDDTFTCTETGILHINVISYAGVNEKKEVFTEKKERSVGTASAGAPKRGSAAITADGEAAPSGPPARRSARPPAVRRAPLCSFTGPQNVKLESLAQTCEDVRSQSATLCEQVDSHGTAIDVDLRASWLEGQATLAAAIADLRLHVNCEAPAMTFATLRAQANKASKRVKELSPTVKALLKALEQARKQKEKDTTKRRRVQESH